jgi:hypothetical protein
VNLFLREKRRKEDELARPDGGGTRTELVGRIVEGRAEQKEKWERPRKEEER